MPLDEEGAKWSCEPCIRGHRSSKCQHFDRMMMKVPKAGRPLARCPHPKGTCSCQKTYAFMIRIPKGSGCLCRPVYQVPADAAGSVSSTPATPMLTPSSAPNKVQKSGKRQIKTAPENLNKALNSIPEFGKQLTQTQNEFLNNPISYTTQDGEPSEPYTTATQDSKALNDSIYHVSENLQDVTVPEPKSCCSRAQKPTVSTLTPEAQRSCCAKPKPTSEVECPNGTQNGKSVGPQSSSSIGNATPFSPFANPQVFNWQNLQTVKRDPNLSSSSLFQIHQPLSSMVPEYLSHYNQTSLEISLHASSSNETELPQALMPPQFPELTEHLNLLSAAAEDGDVNHECYCGDNCQCLGCASHPFNNTTQQHVREMGLLVALNDDEQGLESPCSRQNSPLLGQQPVFSPLQYSYTNFGHPSDNLVQQLGTHPLQSGTPGSLSGGYTTPSTNYLPSQHMMEPSEYYTLEYPIGLPSACSDMTGSCQCGNDCTCEGCLTHSGHNGYAVAPGTSEKQSWDNADFPNLAADGAMPGTSEMSTLENVFVPSHSML
ncbi:putative copper-activated transcription factor GRISEA [Aspergillus saccharolyticus JOP 1030-1]|uniref:Copper-fist domain-containing protein n=1 Tax=Aspergillus saccharolyticus JOP 1030-1 TaxID=1450539 RepID=A0A318ZPE5_9EURO|nr:hypothetical protein BP01DRAFT_147259 [Aspergillus saccharolyticus JOP 1030-1]PYH48404.1 hypothetical protein BP01DRAFT_147259 [Aspergillus saccharolyticus JOP 1030-1]